MTKCGGKIVANENGREATAVVSNPFEWTANTSVNKSTRDFIDGDSVKKVKKTSDKERAKKLFLYAFFGAFIGIVNGLFGAGGGMLAVPVLAIVGGLDERRAHATAILVMLPLCLASAGVYLAENTVEFDLLLPSMAGIFLGGIAGAKLLKFLPETLLFFVFNLLVLIAGLKMLF